MEFVRRPSHEAVTHAMDALVTQEGIVGNRTNRCDVMIQIGSAPRGKEGFYGAVEGTSVAFMASQGESGRPELLEHRSPQDVRTLMAIRASITLAILQQLERLFRPVPVHERDQGRVLMVQIHVVLPGDMWQRLKSWTIQVPRQRFRWSDILAAEYYNESPVLWCQVVVKAPESPLLEHERPLSARWNRHPNVELRENVVGGVNIGSWPEWPVGPVEESNPRTSFHIETMWKEPSPCIICDYR
jgi:hypothetical protein